MIGQTLGSYRIVGLLGEGGMGVVYSAEHPLIGRKAAVKLLLPQFSQNKEVVDRFFNEARAATLVKHGGIVDIFDFGYTEDGDAYIVMELLDGESLTDRLGSAPLPELDAARLARQVASALAAAHDAGIVHRDLKPDNIFIVPDSEVRGGERVKVLDFGIAKLSGDAGAGMTKTQTGTMMGSPLYMSPEQCRGAGGVDARTDIYSLGCLLYEMVCGQPPFNSDGVGELIGKHIYEQPTAPRQHNDSVSEPLERVILAALAKDPDQRIGSMNAFIVELDRATANRFATSSPRPTQAHAVPPSAAASARPSKTTLGSAASEVSQELAAVRGGRGRIVAMAIGAVVVGGGAFALLLGGGAASDGPRGERGEPPTRRAAAAGAPSPAAVATSDAAPDTVTFSISAEPRALVRGADGALLGETPYALTVPRDATTHELRLEAAGYEAEPLSLVADRDRASNTALTRKRPARATPKKPRPKPRKPAPKTDDDPYDPFD